MKRNKLVGYIPIIGLFLIFVIDFTFIVTTHMNWDNSMQKYLPIRHEINALQNNLSKAHLWLEEAIAGDAYVDIEEDVMTPFKSELFHIYVKNAQEIFSNSQDYTYLEQLKAIDTTLYYLYDTAQLRWGNLQEYGIGSDLDQEFDANYKNTIFMINTLSSQINLKLSSELQDRNKYFSWVLLLFLFVNSTIFFMLYIAKKRQQKYEQSLFQEKEKAFVTLRSIGDAVVTTDVNGSITFFNEVAEKLTEYTNEEVQGLPIDEVLTLYNMRTNKKIVTPIFDVLHNNLTKLISNGTKLVSKTNKEYIISDSAAPVKSRDGEIIGTVLVFQDDTQRHKVDDALRQSESQYRNLIESIKDHYFFYAHGTDGIFKYVSNSVTDVLGYSKDEFMVHYADYLTSDPVNNLVEEFTEKSIKGEIQFPYILSIYHKNQDIKYLEVTESPVSNEYGDVISVEGVARDITQNYLAQKNILAQKELLDYKAHYDSLTDLPNRALFLDRLTQSIKFSGRLGSITAVLFIDLDHFKEINDSLGHHIGDKVLKESAKRLSKQIRTTDTIARLGGDEFTIILDDISDELIIINIITKLMDAMKTPIILDNQQFYVTLSIGISMYPNDGSSADVLLKNADAAMYKAKDDGRNTYRFYTQDMTKKAFERIVMETALRKALKGEEFIVYYQPQFNAKEEKLIGMEALVRWKHPTLGLVTPDKFITLAEEIGLIVPLDQWVMKMAMKQLVQWYSDGLNPGVLALNLSVNHLQQNNLIDILSNMLQETGCKAEWLELEVTEGQIMKNPEQAIVTLNKIHSMGVEIAVDDFGTGYSSLSYLKRLPIDKLKIDKSFIDNLPNDEEDSGIAKAIIALCKSLNLNVIAEGVETKEQKDFLVEAGCENIQGYYYSKPIQAKDLEIILRDKTNL